MSFVETTMCTKEERLTTNQKEVAIGQWLTFPFPFVHHQPLHESFSWSKRERTGEDRRLPTVETRTRWLVVVFCLLLSRVNSNRIKDSCEASGEHIARQSLDTHLNTNNQTILQPFGWLFGCVQLCPKKCIDGQVCGVWDVGLSSFTSFPRPRPKDVRPHVEPHTFVHFLFP